MTTYVTKYAIEFKMTCPAYPEQYDVYKGDEYVAYVRLRWGELTVHPVFNGEVEWTKEICSFDLDNLDGEFKNKIERMKHLKECAIKINEWLLNGRSDEVLEKSEPSERDRFLERMIDNIMNSTEQDWKPLDFTINPYREINPYGEFQIIRGKEKQNEKIDVSD